MYGETYSDLVTRLSSESLRRRKSAQATRDSASSSSLWPTAKAISGGANSKREERGAGGPDLQEAAENWGAPTARDWKDGGADLTNVPENGLLGRQAANWPTPTTMLTGDRTAPEVFDARQRKMKERHKGNTGNGCGPDLAMVARTWSTPVATDGEKGGPNQARTAGGMPPLPAQAQNWSTPSVADTTGSRKSRSGDRSDEPLLNGQAEIVSLRTLLPDRPISTVGEESSHIRRSLNPLFVEWLMGWPRGWTSQALMPPASSGSACSETALSLWKQRMRSALLQLGLPDDPPVQQSLFG